MMQILKIKILILSILTLIIIGCSNENLVPLEQKQYSSNLQSFLIKPQTISVLIQQ